MVVTRSPNPPSAECFQQLAAPPADRFAPAAPAAAAAAAAGCPRYPMVCDRKTHCLRFPRCCEEATEFYPLWWLGRKCSPAGGGCCR